MFCEWYDSLKEPYRGIIFLLFILVLVILWKLHMFIWSGIYIITILILFRTKLFSKNKKSEIEWVEVSLKIKKSILHELERCLPRPISTIAIVRFGLVVLSWVNDEKKRGRTIYSCDSDGNNKQILAFPWDDNSLQE